MPFTSKSHSSPLSRAIRDWLADHGEVDELDRQCSLSRSEFVGFVLAKLDAAEDFDAADYTHREVVAELRRLLGEGR